MTRKHFIAGVITFCVLALGIAGFFYWKSASFSPPLSSTAHGFLFEDFLPAGVSFVASFNPTDSEEKRQFRKFWNAVFQDKSDAILPFIATQFLAQNKIEFRLDQLASLINSDMRFVFATAPARPEAEFYFLFAAPNAEAVRNFLDDIKKNGSSLKTGMAGDIAIITNKENYIFSGEKLVNSFSRSKLFRRVFSQIQKPLSGYVFFNNINERWATGENLIAFHAEKEGLRMSTSAFDERKSAQFQNRPAAYLYRRIPLQNAVFFAESQNLASLLQEFSDKDTLSQLENITGLDLEEDILPFARNGFAFVMNSGISLYIDASSAVEKAEQFIAKLDAALPNLLYALNAVLQSAEDKPIFEYIPEISKESGGGTVKIFPKNISEKIANIPLFQLLDKPISLSYWLTKENILFVCICNPDVIASAEDVPLLKKTLALNKESDSIFLIDINKLHVFFDNIAEKLRSKKVLSKTEEEAVSIIEKYLAPLEVYFYASKRDSDSIKGSGILKIQTPTTEAE